MVLDTSAIVAIFKREPGHEALEAKIDDAETILVGAPTLVETVIVLAGQSGKDHRVMLEAYLRRIDARVVECTEGHYLLAGEAFVRFGRGFNPKSNLNYGDCLSYAVAALAGEPLLFVGGDFAHTDLKAA